MTGDSAPALLTVVATTGVVADLVRRIAGEKIRVESLMGAGIDPHLYRPTASDVSRMMRADVIFYSGLRLEGAMETALEQARRSGRLVEAVTADLPRDRLRFPVAFEGHPDPHVWHDAELWAQCATPVVRVLSQRLPEQADAFERRADAVRAELRTLHESTRAALATIPEPSRVLVTAHDAFGYFAAAYGLRVRSVQGITTESEPGVGDINDLVDFLVRQRIPAVFVETTVNERNLLAVIEGARRRGWEVRIGGLLYSDSLGPPGTPAGTYPGMLLHNVRAIVTALGGTVSPAPANGD